MEAPRGESSAPPIPSTPSTTSTPPIIPIIPSTPSIPSSSTSSSDSKVVILEKEERFDILSEAAEFGRLTRLNEHVVEAVAGPTEDDMVIEQESHGINAPVLNNHINTDVTTSIFQIAIAEAAEKGKLRRLKPVVTEGYREREEVPDNLVTFTGTSHFKDDDRISKFLEEERQRKHTETPLERVERTREALEQIQFLSPKAIQKPTVKAKIPLRMRENVAKMAATQSQDRTHRINNEDNELKITFQCQCPHCKNASPFQTNFYKSLQKEQLQRIKSQRSFFASPKPQAAAVGNTAPTLGGITEAEEEDEEDEDEEVVDEKLLKLRKQVEASIKVEEDRRNKEEKDRIQAQKHANIQAAKAILEKNLFQPKPEKDDSKVESIDPDVLYSNTFGKAYTPAPALVVASQELDENGRTPEEQEMDEQIEEEDLRQLTELYDRQDAGEKVDEERIYELELFDRARRDAYLTSDEQRDLEMYTTRRQRTDKFIEEYEDVMSRLNNDGEEIDEHRAYQLEYVVKKRGLSQDLTMAEESAMIQFETEEYLKDGLDPEDFKTSFGRMGMLNEAADGEDDDQEGNHASQHSKQGEASGNSADFKRGVSSIQNKSSNGDVPDAVESSDSDSDSSSNSSSNSSQSDDDSEGDNASLSYYEKDELQDLTEYKEMGEDIDMDRYMDLFLFDKWKNGGKLNKKEMERLNDFKRRRIIETKYREEFANLVQLQATGQAFDEHRFYFLQLFARRQVGQPLNEEETSDLAVFERDEKRKQEEREEERRKQRKAKNPVAEDSDSSKSSHHDDDGDDKSASSRKSSSSNEDEMVVIDNGPSIFDRVSRTSHVMGQEAKAARTYKKSSNPKLPHIDDEEEEEEDDSMEGSQSDDSDHGSNGDQPPQEDEPAVRVVESEQKDEEGRPSSDNEKDESGDSSYLSPDELSEYLRLIEDKDKGIDVDEDRLKLLRLINMWQFGESMSVQQEFKLDDFRRKRRKARELKKEFEALLERGENGEEVDEDRLYLLELFARKQIGEKLTQDEALDLKELEEKEGLTDAEGELPPPSAMKEVVKGESDLYCVVSLDDESLPSTGEVEELEELLERQANNEEFDDKRLYALQLLMKWNNGDGFDTAQLNDLSSLRYQRRKDRYYKKEFEELLGKGDQGSEVDEDRIYFLQLYARRLLGEPLSYDEVVDLDRFEHDETVTFEKEEQIVPKSKEDTSMSTSEIDGDEISNAPVAAPAPEHVSEAGGESNHSVPDPWSNPIPEEDAKGGEETKEETEEPDINDDNAALALPTPQDTSEESASKRSNNDAENMHEEESSEGNMANVPETSPESGSTPQITSRDFMALNTVPNITPQTEPTDSVALKNVEDGTKEMPSTRDQDTSVATTVPATEESSQIELQSTDERSAFPSSVIEVIHESLSQETDEGRSTLDDHPVSRGWKDKGSAIPQQIMGAMEANASLLKELDAARLETHEARERAGQEVAKRAAAEDNAKYAESEAMRAKAALATAEQQRLNYVEPSYHRTRGIQEKTSNVPESYLSVMAFNTKLLEQLNDARRAALEATEQAKEEAIRRALAEENAKKAETDVVFAREALATVDRKRELPSSQTKDMSPELLQPFMAAMEANAKLLEQLDEARKNALEAKTRATKEKLKRAAAEQNAKHAAREAEMATIMLLERDGTIPAAGPWSVDKNVTAEMSSLLTPQPSTEESLAEKGLNADMDPEERAQQRRERAMRVVAERRRRDAEQAEARTEVEEMEKEHREQVRMAVEERKRKTREAMEARKKMTVERAMEGMKSFSMTSTGDEALQAAKRAKELLQAKRARTEASAPKESVQMSSPKPAPMTSFDYLEPSVEADHHDPPVQSSNDPPGTQAVGKIKPSVNGPIHRDPSGDALRSEAFVDRVVTKDPSEGGEGAEKDEITHDDWYSKMEKIAIGHTTEHGQDDIQQEGSNMSPEDWYQEIEALSRDSDQESDADSDMKRAIEEAQRKAQASNMEADEIENEMSEDIEAIRREVMKMSKDKAVDQILRQVSSDAKSNPRQDSSIGRPSSFDPDFEPSTPGGPTYTVGDLSEGGSSATGGGFELRSQQASYEKGYYSSQQRSSRKPGPLRKEKNKLSKTSAPKGKPAGRTKPNRMKNISWRSNPKDTFSDWRVEIKHKETGKVDVYHLHRNILGYGVRKSEYFAAQFQEDRVVNGYYDTKSPKVTNLDLPEAWANLFPTVLDFLYYNRENSLKLTANRSCAMYKWAEFLGIPALKTTINEFFNKNVTLKNFSRFIASAVQMKAGPLIVTSKSKIGRLVTQQPNQSWRLAPQFLVSVLEANRKELITKAKNKEVQPQAFQNASCKWSKAIYYCVSKNKKQVTHKIFSDLTSETAIPVIDPTIALALLILDVELRKDNEYSKFQKRCVRSIVQNWDSFRLKYPNQNALTAALQKLPSDVLAEILIMSNSRSKSNPQTAI